MFRRRPSTLPPDPIFPADLKKLGYFIDSKDKIRSIEHPEECFQFFITNNDRYNEVHREAFHDCVRREVLKRLSTLALHPLYLPTLSTTKPDADEPHLPILCNAPEDLRRKRRIIVILNQLFDDLGIFSYRELTRGGGIDKGSAVCVVRQLLAGFSELLPPKPSMGNANDGIDGPGIIMLNPGQLLYSYRQGTAMTPTTWNAKPRKSAVHPIPTALAENHVPGNATVDEHLSFVFDKILCNDRFIAKDAELYFIGLGDGGNELVTYLEKNWTRLSSSIHIAAIALTAPLPILPSTAHIPLTNMSFLSFLAGHARAWTLSPEPLGTHITDATPLAIIEESFEKVMSEKAEAEVEDEEFLHLCPNVSGGEELYAECVMTTAYGDIVDWFVGLINKQ